MEQKYDLVIVLGCSDYRIMRGRASTAYEFCEENKINRVLLVGGIGKLSPHRKKPEAHVMKDWFWEWRYDGEVIIEDRSSTTNENFKKSFEIMRKIGGKQLLVTSGFHMKRAYNKYRRVKGIKLDKLEVQDRPPVLMWFTEQVMNGCIYLSERIKSLNKHNKRDEPNKRQINLSSRMLSKEIEPKVVIDVIKKQFGVEIDQIQDITKVNDRQTSRCQENTTYAVTVVKYTDGNKTKTYEENGIISIGINGACIKFEADVFVGRTISDTSQISGMHAAHSVLESFIGKDEESCLLYRDNNGALRIAKIVTENTAEEVDTYILVQRKCNIKERTQNSGNNDRLTEKREGLLKYC